MCKSLIWILAALFHIVFSETIHFTNSPSHLLGSKNFTSYKLLVKNSDPITIIEANKELQDTSTGGYHNQNDRIDFAVEEDDSQNDDGNFIYKKTLVANVGGSHHLEKKNFHNIGEAIGVTIDANPDEIATTRNENKMNGDSVGIKKLVYSPVLLKKFVKEYTEKLKNADVGTKNAIQEIGEKINNQNSKNDNNNESDELEKDDKVEEKYNFNSFNDRNDGNKRRRPTLSSSSSSSGNSYKDRDGWVTLEAVPWSSSTVSKWHAYGNNKHDDRRRPSSNSGYHSSHNDRLYSSGSSKFPYHDDSDDDNYYSRPKPTNIDRDGEPNVFSAWTKPQNLGRPLRPQYNYGDSSAFSSGGSDKFYDRPSHERPWSDDIITDHRPSNFPGQSSSNSNYYNNNRDTEDRYSALASNTHSTYQSKPTEGNGEWVLISTTKGYQIPGGRRQHGKRAMSLSHSAATTINIPQVVAHKAIKLTVLPPLEVNSKNSTFSTDNIHPNRDKTTMTTSHGGLIEVDSNLQTVDEDVQATAQTINFNLPLKPTNKPKNSISIKKRRKLIKGN